MRGIRSALLLLIFTAAVVTVAAAPRSVEKRLGDRLILLPQVAGFVPACEENKALAQRAAGLTPKGSEFLTCFVEASKWRTYLAGQASDLYPYLAMTAVNPHPSGPFTAADFEKLRGAAHSQLGDLVANLAASKTQLKEQEAKLAESGIDLKRENYRQNLKGFFKVPGETRSFSYLVVRSARLEERGQSKQVCETNVVSTILFEGRLIGLMVIDDCSSSEGSRSREITSRWLRAFWDANRSST